MSTGTSNLKKIALLTVIVSIATLMTSIVKSGPISPIHQLRIYEVPQKNSVVFHERFKDHAQRIMKKYDFNIIAMWETKFEDRVEFIYLLEWQDENAMEDAWNRFMADQEWIDIKAETGKIHGTFVEKIEDRILIPTDYSPRQRFK